MTTIATSLAAGKSDFLAIATVAFLGAAILFTAGFVSSATLHAAAHDTRHATGFPCH